MKTSNLAKTLVVGYVCLGDFFIGVPRYKVSFLWSTFQILNIHLLILVMRAFKVVEPYIIFLYLFNTQKAVGFTLIPKCSSAYQQNLIPLNPGEQ